MTNYNSSPLFKNFSINLFCLFVWVKVLFSSWMNKSVLIFFVVSNSYTFNKSYVFDWAFVSSRWSFRITLSQVLMLWWVAKCLSLNLTVTFLFTVLMDSNFFIAWWFCFFRCWWLIIKWSIEDANELQLIELTYWWSWM